jgi:SAM-dependent methyltransferase
MLRSLMEHDSLDQCVWVGLDIQFCRLQYAKVNVPFVLQADGKNLPFCSQSADIIILTAVLKHVTGLASLLAECRRVLRLGGQVIATDPTPLGIEWGLVLGHFTRQEIRHTLNLEDTRTLFLESGFRVIHAEHFMLSPIPFRGAEVIESMLKRMRLDQFFFNQIICAECLPI